MNKKEAKEITIYDLPGVGAATAEKLKEAGYETLMAIAVATPGEITELSGLGEAAARKIINFARNSMSMGFETGEEVMKKRDNLTKLSTGSKNLDTLFGGGVETGSITETFGAFGSGKCIEKDAEVLYFNSSKSHLERMEDIYEKYKQRFGEKPMDGGYAVEVPPVNVLGLTGNKLGQVRAKFLFREKVAKLYEIITKRGRKLRVTGPHKLLSFNQNLQWKPAAIINNGDIIAYPKKLECNGECSFDKEDAYFLGMFAAEGSKKIDISNSSPVIINWIKAYVKEKFGFDASVWKDNRNEVHYIGLRKASRKILGDLADCTSENKFVPPELLQSSEEIAASFLAGYIDGDGYMGKDGFEATTKSKILANGLSYMFLRMGIAVTMKEKIVHGDTFWRLTVTSGDSEKLNMLPCKIKSGNYKHRNTSYGYSKDIIDYLRASYQETLGGNRGRHTKLIGKHNSKRMAYSYLTNSTLACQNMNEKTLLEVYNLFLSGKENVKKAISLAETLEDLDKESFLMLYELLPFAFNSFSQELGISKSTFQNYPQRGVPKRDKKTILKIKGPLLDKLNKIGKKLDDVLVVMKGIGYFNWDTIESIKEIEYNDYVYDFVVPEGHCFVGGNMPTILHNTSIAHQLAVNVQLPKEKGGGDGIAVWIDSESTFRPERIKQICADLSLDPLEALRNIRVVRVFNSDHQMLVAEKVEDLITKDKLPVRLVIVDSLMAHFRAEFCGRGQLADRQQKLNKHMHVLMKMADMYNFAVYVTNQVMAKPDTFFGDPTAAIGGNIVGHNSQTRVYLRRGKGGTRVAKLVDSPHLPDGEAVFQVVEGGIKDA